MTHDSYQKADIAYRLSAERQISIFYARVRLTSKTLGRMETPYSKQCLLGLLLTAIKIALCSCTKERIFAGSDLKGLI